MGQRGEWIPPNAPLSEEYWQSLLREGANSRTALASRDVGRWDDAIGKDPTTRIGAGESSSADDVWKEARILMDEGRVVQLPVVGCNRGGLLVGWKGIQGFVPASHVERVTPSGGEAGRREELQHLIGTRLRLRIIELDPINHRLVLSERPGDAADRTDKEIWSTLEPGDVCEGSVTNLCSFGAFVDLGGFEGLIHISELSWGRVGHPADVLEVGEIVEVYVLNVEPERERVGLSIKRLQPNPWESVEERYAVGELVDGTVTHVVDFGAFVQVEEGLEGLVHVSELPSGSSENPHDVLQVGDQVAVKVLDVDRARRRMGLRLEQVQGGAEFLDSDVRKAER